MNRTLVGTGLIGLACLLGTVGCALQEAAVQPTSGGSSESAAAEATQEVTPKALSDSLEGCLERIQDWTKGASPYWFGAGLSFHDAYAFTLLRWGGFAGINPDDLPGYERFLEEEALCYRLGFEKLGPMTSSVPVGKTRLKESPENSRPNSSRLSV